MLGHRKRTTRLDIGLALGAVGITFLIWSFVAGVSRDLMGKMMRGTAGLEKLPDLTTVVKIFFVDTGFVIDIVGLAWMVVGLFLVILSSRQKISISWAWLSTIIQSFVTGLGALLVGWAVYAPHVLGEKVEPGIMARLSHISLPVVLAIAILVWVVVLIWLLVDRARVDRHGPTLTDGLRTHR